MGFQGFLKYKGLLDEGISGKGKLCKWGTFKAVLGVLFEVFEILR